MSGMEPTVALRFGCLLLAALAVAILVYAACRVPVPMAARLGHRGVQRRRALEQGGLFVQAEPLIRFGAGLWGRLRWESLRRWQERLLVRGDDYLGLTPDELSASSVLSAVGLGSAVIGLAASVEVLIQNRPLQGAWLWGAAGALLGLALPTLQLRQVIKARTRTITRGLPGAIEVVAMCMRAGLDFPGALRQLCVQGKGDDDPLRRELSVLLQQLDLGRTRKAALRGFALRVPSDAVRDFTNAVIQAEEKGNPLAEVIQVQGRMLNERRSVMAEEAAARAGVLMIVPMMFLVACILLLLMGPFLVKGIGF